MTLDFADAHAARVYGDELLVEIRKSQLISGEPLRIEGRQSTGRNCMLGLGVRAENFFYVP